MRIEEDLFRLAGDKSVQINYPGSDREPVFITLEDLYQQFKARMIKELRVSCGGNYAGSLVDYE